MNILWLLNMYVTYNSSFEKKVIIQIKLMKNYFHTLQYFSLEIRYKYILIIILLSNVSNNLLYKLNYITYR